jgi:hypothetical protein
LVLAAAALLLLLARPARSESLYDYAVYNYVYLYIDDPLGTGTPYWYPEDYNSRDSLKTWCAVWEGVCTFSGTLEGFAQFRLIPHEVYNSSTARATGRYRLDTMYSLCTGIWTSAEPGYKVLNETGFRLHYPYGSGSAPIDHRFTSTIDASWYSYRPYDSARVDNFKGHWTDLGAFSEGSWLEVTVYSAKVRFEYFVYTKFTGSYAKPPQKVTLTVQVYRATASGPTTAPANGTKVKIGGTTYTADSSGKVPAHFSNLRGRQSCERNK